jgi:pimeloyl-ACP methyl ester carboxylesterase
MNDQAGDAPEISDILFEADGVTLSGLLATPRHDPPRALVVALHGAGLRAGYFHGQAAPGQSLLSLGAELGFTMLSLDRPGYGLSATALPAGQLLAEQSATLRAGLADYAMRSPVGAGVFLLAHSYGGQLALAVAADGNDGDLIGLDLSGVGHHFAVDQQNVSGSRSRFERSMSWGPLSLYPPGAFRQAGPLICEVPAREREEMWAWPERFPAIAAGVGVPVRLTFAEHERWWCHDEMSLGLMTDLLAPARVVIDRLSDAGHNISLGWAARTYHLRAFAFLEECLMMRKIPPRKNELTASQFAMRSNGAREMELRDSHSRDSSIGENT